MNWNLKTKPSHKPIRNEAKPSKNEVFPSHPPFLFFLTRKISWSKRGSGLLQRNPFSFLPFMQISWIPSALLQGGKGLLLLFHPQGRKVKKSSQDTIFLLSSGFLWAPSSFISLLLLFFSSLPLFSFSCSFHFLSWWNNWTRRLKVEKTWNRYCLDLEEKKRNKKRTKPKLEVVLLRCLVKKYSEKGREMQERAGGRRERENGKEKGRKEKRGE